MPNLTPDLHDYDLTEPTPAIMSIITPSSMQASADENANQGKEPKKKKYAKEAWPGKRPSGSMLIVKWNAVYFLSVYRQWTWLVLFFSFCSVSFELSLM